MLFPLVYQTLDILVDTQRSTNQSTSNQLTSVSLSPINMLRKFLQRKRYTNEGEESSRADESRQESYEFSDGSCDRTEFDTDIRNSELVIDRHHDDPFEVMRIQTYDDAPMARGKVCLT